MPRSVTCPGCQRLLRVPDGITTADVTCPRCLALVPNPHLGAVEAVGETPSRETSCPRCGKPVEKQWRFCPNCEAVLAGPRRGARGVYFDDEVRRDRTGTSVILILLAVLGGIGMCAYLWAGVAALEEGTWQLLAGVILGVLFLALVSTGIMYYRTRNDPSRRGVGRVVVGTLALTGGLFGLSCVLGVAFVLYFFIACLMNPSGFR
jgi:hypothetical protein